MSDGMSEAAEFERQEKAVQQAAHNLAVALKEADDGHGGWSINRSDLAGIVNGYLEDEGAPFTLKVIG